MKKSRIIPFKWLPSSWGLSGQLLEEQEARYYYEGIDLEERLAEIYYSGDDLKHALLEIRHEHGALSDSEYDVGKAELIVDELEREVAIIEAKIKNNELTDREGDKEIANLRGEPWIKVIADGIDHEMGIDGYYFEFDWNDLWVAKLREAGYMGATEEAIVQAWFQDVCRMEASASMGDAPINSGIVF